MSVAAAHDVHEHGHDPNLCHQYVDIEQQNETYVVGMWTFLVTEIMFFGALFLCYTIYRNFNPGVFHILSKEELNRWYGGINTVVLLTSSFSMALAVYSAQMGPSHRRGLMLGLAVTIALSFVFLGIKAVEWTEKFEKHHVPGPSFHYEPEGEKGPAGPAAHQPAIGGGDQTYRGFGSIPATQSQLGAPGFIPHEAALVIPTTSDKAQLFFCLYFAMTGLHALHVIIGILIMGALLWMVWKRHPAVRYYMPIEMAGLYWHFVDIVWIFLFPLFYLIPNA